MRIAWVGMVVGAKRIDGWSQVGGGGGIGIGTGLAWRGVALDGCGGVRVRAVARFLYGFGRVFLRNSLGRTGRLG